MVCEVDLGSFGLFGGAPIQADSAWDFVLSHHFLQHDGRPNTSCSKEVVTTAVTAGDLIFARRSIRDGFVSETWQRIIFGQKA